MKITPMDFPSSDIDQPKRKEIKEVKEATNKGSFFERMVKSKIWKALEETGRKRAEHAIRHGYY